MNWAYASGSQVSEKPVIRDTGPSRSSALLGATLSFEQPWQMKVTGREGAVFSLTSTAWQSIGTPGARRKMRMG